MTTKDDIERDARQDVGRRALDARDKGPRLRVEGGLGGSPVPVMQQLRHAAIALLTQTVSDGDGALVRVLEQDLRQEQALFGPLAQALVTHPGPDVPRAQLLGVLAAVAQRALVNEEALADFTRRVDAGWGRLYAERPHFQAVGQRAAHGDPYTHDSVRAALMQLVALAAR